MPTHDPRDLTIVGLADILAIIIDPRAEVSDRANFAHALAQMALSKYSAQIAAARAATAGPSATSR